MEKHVGLNPAWFEPRPEFNNTSPFFDEYNNQRESGVCIGKSISAAFRAIIAQDAAQEPPALQVGDVVRLERYLGGEAGLAWTITDEYLVGRELPIESFSVYCNDRVRIGGTAWPVSALTLVRRAGEPAPVEDDDRKSGTEIAAMASQEIDSMQSTIDKLLADMHAKDAEITRLTAERDAMFNRLESRTLDRNMYALRCTDKDEEIARLTDELHARNDEIVGLRAEVDRLTAERNTLELNLDIAQRQLEEMKMHYAAATARADALQARIDAGVPVYSGAGEKWNHNAKGACFAALLLDVKPVAMAPARPIAGTIADRGKSS